MGDRLARQSNIELLRIFAAFGVIILHINNLFLGGRYGVIEDGSKLQFLVILSESISICAVNLYVLITGYFMRDSKKISLKKPINLLAQFLIFELFFYLVKELPKGEGFSITVFVKYFTPAYWFVFVYIALYFVSPYLNLMWKHLEDKGKRRLLVTLVALFSVYPIICEFIENIPLFGGTTDSSGEPVDILHGISTVGLFGSQSGYTIVIFVLMYLIGCFIRDKEESLASIKMSRLIILLILNIALIVGWTYIQRMMLGSDIISTVGWHYDNPLVISEAVILFLIFRKLDIKNSRLINTLAAASFATYLIHINLLEYVKIEAFMGIGMLSLAMYVLLSLVVIYLISFAFYEIYSLVTRPVWSHLGG